MITNDITYFEYFFFQNAKWQCQGDGPELYRQFKQISNKIAVGGA